MLDNVNDLRSLEGSEVQVVPDATCMEFHACGYWLQSIPSAGAAAYSYEDAVAAGAITIDGNIDPGFASAHPMLAAQLKAGSLPTSKGGMSSHEGADGSGHGASTSGRAASPAHLAGMAGLPPMVGMSAAQDPAGMPAWANFPQQPSGGGGPAGPAGMPAGAINPAALASYAKLMSAAGVSTGVGGSPSVSLASGDPSWMLYETAQIKERLTAMERKSEALWHVRVGLHGSTAEGKHVVVVCCKAPMMQ